MRTETTQYVIIGSSRGLGAALVEEFLKQTPYRIIGIARTSADHIPQYPTWLTTGRYRHIQLDIASPQCRDVLKSLVHELSPEPLGLIFNAAHIAKDVQDDHTLNYAMFDQINRVGIIGLGNILAAFEHHLLTYRGTLVGISSFWGSVPPLFLPWIAYPASKAYLNVALRCLRVVWRKQTPVVLVTIGNIKNAREVALPTWIIPTYQMAAQKIVSQLLAPQVPKTIHYPWWHAFVYRYILRLVPEALYAWIFQGYLRLESSRQKKQQPAKSKRTY